MSEAANNKKIGLTTKIFIALLLGAVVGALLHAFAADIPAVQNILVGGVFYVIGQGFIRLMQMLVVPLVFCSLVCGAAAIGDTKTLGKVGVKTIGFYLVTTMLAVAVALSVASIVNPGLGLDMSQAQTAETAISESSRTLRHLWLRGERRTPSSRAATAARLLQR